MIVPRTVAYKSTMFRPKRSAFSEFYRVGSLREAIKRLKRYTHGVFSPDRLSVIEFETKRGFIKK